jgi:hypothetical protein
VHCKGVSSSSEDKEGFGGYPKSLFCLMIKDPKGLMLISNPVYQKDLGENVLILREENLMNIDNQDQ